MAAAEVVLSENARRVLARSRGKSRRMLEEALSRGAVTAVVDQLEAAGLVRRVRDTVDRRRVIIETTDEVARQGAPVFGPLIKDADRVLAAFEPDQLEVIAEFVHRQRELLTSHTARVATMLAARSSGPRRRG